MNDPAATRLSETMRWALDADVDPAMASADWLASDINSDVKSAVELLTRHDVSLQSLYQSKAAFKTMRIIGETSADRRLGARLYAASIASALVHHNVRITAQSDAAIARAFSGLAEDQTMPAILREIAAAAMVKLHES